MKVMFHGYRLENLSKFRSPLMGISIIMILLCHARMDGADLPSIIFSLLSLGNMKWLYMPERKLIRFLL